MKNAWAVVEYKHGKAVAAVRNTTDDGIWSSFDIAEVYEMLDWAQGQDKESTWGALQLHRGAEANLLLEIGE